MHLQTLATCSFPTQIWKVISKTYTAYTVIKLREDAEHTFFIQKRRCGFLSERWTAKKRCPQLGTSQAFQHSSYIEMIFSIMANKLRHVNSNRCSLEFMRSKFLITHNFEQASLEFYCSILKVNQLLSAARSDEKYTWKRNGTHSE